ncbi:hypothetical protein AbraIFM66951_011790 [Aspergillus brasiliensis]|uniref:Uncharacterized protein n=1 Tax=Aspergillus brasiliensis TaxID=319629 RepID=A0A9W6DQ86_9EURO|nr:hypothetical protein AbraCBS73388_011952 [Aspergillus brasiliensis]GKZ48040.1 hypothetical protein AbraIFM66951_011790 [Aspergillus brasiliensis]
MPPENGLDLEISAGDDEERLSVGRSLNWYHVDGSRAIDYLPLDADWWWKDIQAIFCRIHNWVRNHAERKHTNLSLELKKDLISRLDGYCIQDDFDTIMSSLPRRLRNRCLTYLVHLYVAKECLSRLFTNPFWYLVPNPGHGDDTEELSTNAPGFGAQLFHLYQRISEADPAAAHLWRLWTTRFSHPKHKLGYDLIAHRDCMANRICQEILGEEPVRSLLRSADKGDLDRALVNLQKIFRSAAELSVKFSCHRSYVEFKTLNTLDPVFHHLSAEVELTEDYGKAGSQHCFDDRRILFLELPAMYLCRSDQDHLHKRLLRKAVAFAEDVAGSS